MTRIFFKVYECQKVYCVVIPMYSLYIRPEDMIEISVYNMTCFVSMIMMSFSYKGLSNKKLSAVGNCECSYHKCHLQQILKSSENTIPKIISIVYNKIKPSLVRHVFFLFK